MMKFSDVLSEAYKKPLFVAAYPDEDTRDRITQYLKDNGIPNAIPRSELHTTLMYSRKPCEQPNLKKDCSYLGTSDGFEIWDTRDNKRALVMKIKCGDLKGRHQKLMKETQGSYDFPEYKAHITMSYDVGGMSISKLPSFTGRIRYNEEYSKVLNLDWKPGDGK